MKIQNKKTHLVAGLALAAILVLSSTSVISVNANALGVSSTSNPSTISNTIPDDKIIKRNWSDWKDQYTIDEFYASENNTQWYVDSIKNNPSLNNNLNNAIAKDLTVIHNFHTMILKKDYGQEVLALIVAKQRLNHVYDSVEPVKRLHDWLISKYEVPSTVSEIDKKLQAMEYDKYAPLVSQVINAYDDAAKNGVVPYELYAQDKNYWGNVSFQSFCQLDVNCSFGKTNNNANTVNTNFNGNILDNVYILVSYLNKMFEPQSAYATTTTHYNTYFFYQFTPSNGCIDGMSCPISQSTTGTGPVSLHFDSNGKHGVGSSMSVYAVAYDKNNYQSSHNVKFTVTVDGYNVLGYQCIDSDTGTGYIQQTQDCSIPDYNQDSTWTFFIDGTADVWSTS
ncbi:MAG: hypothetical protein ACREAR_06675 [Nitrosotalea sp.]